jgi:heme/copper-type cytochrome/quinol oxidase subunit 2
VDGYDVNIQAEPGKSAKVTFVADQEGTFKFRCSVSCGTLHPFMIGELNVEPNLPLVRALAATLIVALGAVIYFWK